MHFVYIVRCADGSLYTGYARDPVARAKQHNVGRGAKYTASRRPVALVYVSMFDRREPRYRTEGALLAAVPGIASGEGRTARCPNACS